MGKRLAAATVVSNAVASTSNNIIQLNTSERYNNIDNPTKNNYSLTQASSSSALAVSTSIEGIGQQIANSRVSALRKRKYNGINNNTNELNKKFCLENSNDVVDNARVDQKLQQYANADDINNKEKLSKQNDLKYYQTKSNNNNQNHHYQNGKKKEQQHQQNGNINNIKKNTTSTTTSSTSVPAISSNQQYKTNSIINHIKTELNDSPRHVYSLRPSIVNGTLLRDLRQNVWRLGQPIGKGNFGEIFLASDNIYVPVTSENAPFVVKMEPHSNGPLFVEIHCLMNTARAKDVFDQKIKIENESDKIKKKKNNNDDDNEEEENDDEDDIKSYLTKVPTEPPTGIPDYITSGSHTFAGTRYRFLILPRYERDLHSLIKNSRVNQKYVLILAIQIIDILEKLHDKGYCHNDIKAQNLMISKCKYKQEKQHNFDVKNIGQIQMKKTKLTKASNICREQLKNIKYKLNDEKQQTTDSGNSSEQEEINEQQATKKNCQQHDSFSVRRITRTTITSKGHKSRRNISCIMRKDFDDCVNDDNVSYYKTSGAIPDKKDVDVDEDEDFDDITLSNSTTSGSSRSINNYQQQQVISKSITPIIKKRSTSQCSQRSENSCNDSSKNSRTSHNSLSTKIEYSGSNPIRSCRRRQEKSHPIYEEMVKSHYLRPTKRVSYLEFFTEDHATSSNHSRSNKNNTANVKNTSSPNYCLSNNNNNTDDVVLKDIPKSTAKNNRYHHRQKQLQANLASANGIVKKKHKMQINSSDDDNGNSDDDNDCDYIEYLSPIMRQKLVNKNNLKSKNQNNYNCKRLTRQQALQLKRLEEIENNNQVQNTQKLISESTKIPTDCEQFDNRNAITNNDGNDNVDDKTKMNIKNEIKIEADNGEIKSLTTELITVEEERIFLIDYGLASKYIDNGIHRPFVMDQRRAHDGTLEFTSRDAHMGAHSRRSDMECLGYNLLFWSEGYLPWKDAANLQQPEKVHRAKEYLMTDAREMLKQIYGSDIPTYLGEFLHLVGQLSYHERPDYDHYRQIFKSEYKQQSYDNYSNNTEKIKKSTTNLAHTFLEKNENIENFRLSMNEIQKTCKPFQEKEIETTGKTDFFEMARIVGTPNFSSVGHLNNINFSNHHHLQITPGSCMTPYIDHTLCNNRVSPKYLRSKSAKKQTKKKQFSWAEVLSQDPDQIARQRAEKEFDREDALSETHQVMIKRYQGNPTYAILQILQRLQRQRHDHHGSTDQQIDCTNQTMRQSHSRDLVTPRNGMTLNGQNPPPPHQHPSDNLSTIVDDRENKCLSLNNVQKKTTNNCHQNNINGRNNGRKSPTISDNDLPAPIDLANNDNFVSSTPSGKNKTKLTAKKKPTQSTKKNGKTLVNCKKRLWNAIQTPSPCFPNSNNSENLTQNTIPTATLSTIEKTTTKSKKNKYTAEPQVEENINNEHFNGAITTPILNVTGRRRRQARRCLATECQKYHSYGGTENNHQCQQYKGFIDSVSNLNGNLITEENN